MIIYNTDTDYSKEEFPFGACILDYLRCSIAFETPKDLLDGVEHVINEIEKEEISSLTKILRIKNGFNNILSWDRKTMKDYNYVDLKMNVIFNNKNNTESQIVEIQFLLDFLLKAKKLGHKYYGIKRKDVQIYSVNNIMMNTFNNYDRYKGKIVSLIKDHDINQLTTHLFLRPNCVLTMIDDDGPLLYTVGEYSNASLKMYSLFLDCILHFGEILLNEKKPNNCNIGCYNDFSKDKIDTILSNHELYIQKYFNFSLGDRPCIDFQSFVKYIYTHIVSIYNYQLFANMMLVLFFYNNNISNLGENIDFDREIYKFN